MIGAERLVVKRAADLPQLILRNAAPDETATPAAG
jgi:hypothetical protein